MFDNVVDAAAVGPRERYEAAARSVRDVLSQRWLRTEQTYERENPKRVYYLSMEFLIGRSLANNVTQPPPRSARAKRVVDDKGLDWLGLLEQEPDAGLGNGGLGRLAACFLDSMATMQLPAMGYGLRYEYGIFRQTIEDGWQHEQPDNWLRRPDPWEVARPQEQVEVKLGCSFEVRGGSLGVVVGRPSSLLGLPVRSPGGGLWRQDHQHAPALGRRRARCLRLPGVQRRRVRERAGRAAHGRIPDAGPLSRRLHEHGAGAALRAGVLPRRLLARPDLVRRFRRSNADWSALPDKVAIQLNDTHPSLAVPELMRILLDEAARLGPGLGPHPADARLHEPHAPARGAGEMAAAVVRGCCCRGSWRSSSRSTAASSRRCGPASRATRAASSA